MATKPKNEPDDQADAAEEKPAPPKADAKTADASTPVTGSPSTIDTDTPHFHRYTKTVIDAKHGEPNIACATEGCKARAYR